jgi:N-acetylglucosamine kinase-like BadF-type ATPase
MSVRGLGLDAGGSATRWAVCAGDAVVASGELPPASGHLFDPAARRAFEAMTAALREAAASHAPEAAVAGVTGLTGDAPEAREAAAILAAALNLPVARVRVEDDLWIGFHAAFRLGEGHAVYAGTGSVGLHIAADGAVLRVGGRGMLIDDAGSAFWIGRRALDVTYRRIDEGEPPGALGESLFAAIGGSSWNEVRAHVYGGGRNAVAQLARAVAGVDDPAARAILHEAGRELARLALALCRRAGAKPVVLLGRAAGLHPAILDGFRQAAPELDVRREEVDAAVAAARVACRM